MNKGLFAAKRYLLYQRSAGISKEEKHYIYISNMTAEQTLLLPLHECEVVESCISAETKEKKRSATLQCAF